jgi:hypothetical protein
MPKRRTLLAVLSGIIVCSLVVAAAASLGGITSASLGADDSVVASCDTNGVTSAYSTVYNTTSTAGFKVNDVTVGGVDDACDGLTMTVTLTGAANASLGSASQAVPTGAGTTNVISVVGQSILAESVTGIHIVIS